MIDATAPSDPLIQTKAHWCLSGTTARPSMSGLTLQEVTMAADITPAETALPMGWRLKLGFVLFPFALIPYGLLAPIVCYDRPPMTVASLVGTGVILQKMLFVSAIAVLGKPGFAFLKQRLFSRIAPPNEVGPTRYQIGLIMFCLPILQGFLNPYASQFAPDLVKNRFWIDVLMDAMQVASVFVLGGNFWDKLRALFVRDARVIFPDPAKQILPPPLAASVSR